MKKLTCRLLVLAVMLLAIGAEAFADVTINETNFPDDVFRNYVIEHFRTYSDSFLSQEKVDNVSQMAVPNMAISSLKGIEYFRNLSILVCNNNRLTALDISNNTALVWLECYNNQLTAVDVSKNTALRALYCDFTITSSDNNFEFNIVDFMKTYKLDENDDYFRDVTFAYYYGEDEDDFGTVGNFLAPETIAANNVVSFTVPEGKTFRYIKMEFAYYYRSNPDDVYFIEVCVYPYHAVSSGTTGIAPIITTADLPDGTEGSSYSAALSAIGSTPITWSILSGSLPDGLSFDSSGTISGTPSAPGAYTFTVQASNSAGTGSKLFSIIVPFSEVRPPKITTTSLTNAFTDSPYGFRLQATGTSTGLTSLTWSADSLPDGLTLSTSGYLSGTPSSAGAFPFTVYVSNSQGSDSADLTLSISASPSNTQPTISTLTPNPAATGQAYTCQLMASGTPPFTWTLAKGKLPAGLSISPSGLITGSPTKKGNKSFTVIAENDFGSNKQKITLNVYDLPSITTTSLKDATVAKKYSASVKKKGSKPLTWELEGSLPQNISFNEDKGKISGKPTVNDKGMIRVTLSNPAGELSKVYSIIVKAIAPTVKNDSLKSGTYGKSYSQNIKLKGTEPIKVIISGDLPEGLSFDSSTKKITGTPSEVCSDRQITIFAVNLGGVLQQTYSLTVNAVAPKIKTKKLPDAIQGNTYSFGIEATGTPTITWSASDLPSGLSMSSSGIISGTPTEAGKFKVKISAANSAKTTEKSYKLTVFANTTQSSTSQTAENITSNSGYITSNSGYIAQNTSRNVSAINDVVMDDVAFTGEYRIVADLGTISVDEAGMYDFTVTLSDDAPAGKELLYLAGSNEPSEDDTIAEFFDETGEEVSTVPESRNVTVSVWLKKDVIYTPSLAVRY